MPSLESAASLGQSGSTRETDNSFRRRSSFALLVLACRSLAPNYSGILASVLFNGLFYRLNRRIDFPLGHFFCAIFQPAFNYSWLARWCVCERGPIINIIVVSFHHLLTYRWRQFRDIASLTPRKLQEATNSFPEVVRKGSRTPIIFPYTLSTVFDLAHAV